MAKESAAQKNRRRREKRAGPPSVSIPNHLAAPPFPHPSLWPDDVRAFVYGPLSADDDGNLEPLTVPIASVRTVPLGPAPVSWADETAETFPLPVPLPPRDWSTLRSDTAHPWRTIRCRNHRLRPLRPERRPFPQSLPKIPSLHHLPSPPQPVIIDIPPPPIAAPTLPAGTAYGLVHSNLALACACELPEVSAAFQEILEITGGPPEDREELGALPPDRLVFLTTLAAIAALDGVFEQFLYPVITDFTGHWVAHRRQDSFG
ncbi:hypothetical protein C8R45DRAFT_1113989 [Mycena sanguinolenta]|nr:hypothetical protein C8R45DRAFT_1113989 [Mycena sanguinolenta]